MPNYIETTDTNPRRFVPVTSRYAESRVIYYTERKILTYSTYRKGEYAPKENDRFMVVEKYHEYRPDKVSFAAYGTSDFWWKIMEANNLKDVYDFKAGLNVRLPDVLFA